ncbi:MAG: GntR family transcriptional regulator [Gemmatimonadota bacterium]
MDPQRLIPRLQARVSARPASPVAESIVEEVWLAVVEGELATGERLPTVRSLSIELGVSPRTVERAVDRLQTLGVVDRRAGEGAFVSLAPPSNEERERHQLFHGLCRATVDTAERLGFDLDDLLDALAEFRTRDKERL